MWKCLKLLIVEIANFWGPVSLHIAFQVWCKILFYELHQKTDVKTDVEIFFILYDFCDCNKKWSFSCNSDFADFCFALKVGLDHVRESC